MLSSKGDTDLLRWYAAKARFPPLLLLRRYLKLAYQVSAMRGVLDCDATTVVNLPFDVDALPSKFPPPDQLTLWVKPLITS